MLKFYDLVGPHSYPGPYGGHGPWGDTLALNKFNFNALENVIPNTDMRRRDLSLLLLNRIFCPKNMQVTQSS